VRTLVTGAAGFIGSNLCLELTKLGHGVVGLDSFSPGSFENLRDFTGDVVSADLADAGSWQDSVGKVDAVFHQAAITDTTVTDQKKMMNANVDAFRTLLSWAAAEEIKTVVYASSAGIYGDGPIPMKESAAARPMNVYAFSKMVMEQTANEARKRFPKMKIVGLRYFNVFGPREKHKAKAASMIWQLAQQMLAGKAPRIFEFGEQYRDHIYVKDVVAANLKAFEKAPSGVYNVCTGRKTTFNEIIAMLNGVLGTSFEPDYFKNPYSFYQNETLGDPTTAASKMGFKSKFTVAQGIEDYFGGRKTAKV